MATMNQNEKLKTALVRFIDQDAYPDSEDVASAEVPSSILPSLLSDLQQARSDVKNEIRQLSREVAPDVDGWIVQAKQLQADIERSKAAAQEIVRQAEAGRSSKNRANDTSSKVNLLENELAFNGSLANILGQLKNISIVLDDARDAIVKGQIQAAVAKVQDADAAIGGLRLVENTRPYGLTRNRIRDVKAAVVEAATASAKSLIRVNTAHHSITIYNQAPENPEVDLSTVVDVLATLDALPSFIEHLKHDLISAILNPRLSIGKTGEVPTIKVDGDMLQVSGSNTDVRPCMVLTDLGTILGFLSAHLPGRILFPLSESLMPGLSARLIDEWLDPTVPVKVDDMPTFQQTLDSAAKLVDQIHTTDNMDGKTYLEEWIRGAPRTWLNKRRETALGSVRSLLLTSVRQRKTVERVETQTVTKDDVLHGGDGADDEWDTAWDEPEQPETAPELPKRPTAEDRPLENGTAKDEDSSAWEMEDDDASQPTVLESTDSHMAEAGDDDADAWGWGDNEEQEPSEAVKPEAGSELKQNDPPNTSETASPQKRPAEREITLKETYSVTAVPDGIMVIIAQVVSDAETLAQPNYAESPIAPAASALYTLPTSALAMYRATASTAYGKIDTGNMLIYNDSLRLVDELETFLAAQAKEHASSSVRPPARLRLENDIKALEAFSKRAYGSEMESQRTILRDLLDGAQGFVNCTVPPFAGECDNAIAMTVDRLREVHRQWESVLSRSALLQSVGSLLNTATAKIMLDISDLSDIGEEESKRLRSYCDKVSTLNDLFMQENANGEKGDMTAVYCPNWLKFQYLAEVLESSLADIKYMWTEGELSLEFGKEEIIDLIEALFADSDYRRRAIGDIRRSGR